MTQSAQDAWQDANKALAHIYSYKDNVPRRLFSSRKLAFPAIKIQLCSRNFHISQELQLYFIRVLPKLEFLIDPKSKRARIACQLSTRVWKIVEIFPTSLSWSASSLFKVKQSVGIWCFIRETRAFLFTVAYIKFNKHSFKSELFRGDKSIELSRNFWRDLSLLLWKLNQIAWLFSRLKMSLCSRKDKAERKKIFMRQVAKRLF